LHGTTIAWFPIPISAKYLVIDWTGGLHFESGSDSFLVESLHFLLETVNACGEMDIDVSRSTGID